MSVYITSATATVHTCGVCLYALIPCRRCENANAVGARTQDEFRETIEEVKMN
jgi:hypothetical protein